MTVSETVSKLGVWIRQIAETVRLEEDRDLVRTLVRVRTEIVQIIEDGIRARGMLQSVSEGLQVVENASHLLHQVVVTAQRWFKGMYKGMFKGQR
jgi:hypothetical protein